MSSAAAKAIQKSNVRAYADTHRQSHLLLRHKLQGQVRWQQRQPMNLLQAAYDGSIWRSSWTLGRAQLWLQNCKMYTILTSHWRRSPYGMTLSCRRLTMGSIWQSSWTSAQARLWPPTRARQSQRTSGGQSWALRVR